MQRGWVLSCGVAMALGGGVAAAFADTIQVAIDRLVFAPSAIKARVGDTIEWVNRDVVAHTATVKGGWEVMIPPKASARMVVRKEEAVEYYCRFHPNMTGRLTASAR
jgi:plastocyanin